MATVHSPSEFQKRENGREVILDKNRIEEFSINGKNTASQIKYFL
jgi:hypothetical protein